MLRQLDAQPFSFQNHVLALMNILIHPGVVGDACIMYTTVVNFYRRWLHYLLRIVMTNVIPPQDASNPTTHPARQHSETQRLYKCMRKSYRTPSSTDMLRTMQGYVTHYIPVRTIIVNDVHRFLMYLHTFVCILYSVHVNSLFIVS